MGITFSFVNIITYSNFKGNQKPARWGIIILLLEICHLSFSAISTYPHTGPGRIGLVYFLT